MCIGGGMGIALCVERDRAGAGIRPDRERVVRRGTVAGREGSPARREPLLTGTRTFRIMTRLGFAARGLIYVLIGYLALRSGRTEEPGGILACRRAATGRLLVAGMAAGFLAYGVWRLVAASIDTDDHGADTKGMIVRLAGATSGIIHLGLGALAARLAAGNRGGGDSPETAAATALDLPGGALVLYLAAAVLFATALAQLHKAWRLKFLRRLEPRAAAQGWIAWLGRIGFLSRGIVFGLVSWFFLRAAQAESSAAAGGIDEALGSLPRALQAAVAAGLVLFGLFSLVEARFRRVAEPGLLSGRSH